MIDPAAYRAADTRAYRSSSEWIWRQILCGSHLDGSGFPADVESIQDLRPLIDSIDNGRFHKFVRELNGLRPDDMNLLVALMHQFAWFYVQAFQDRNAVLPVNGLLSHLPVFRKIVAQVRHRSVLEIGGGSGFLSFFLATEPKIEQQARIEITPSFYVLQSLINSFLYGPRFEDRALAQDPPLIATDFTRGMTEILPGMEGTPRFALPLRASVKLFPWWRIPEAFSDDTTYDVVVSKANLFEMSNGAYMIYFTNISRRLSPEGVVLIQDLGTGQAIAPYDRLEQSLSYGFRPLVYCRENSPLHPLASDNVLLVREGHPHWDDAARDFSAEHFPATLPLVRQMYGLDLPAGDQIGRRALVQEFVKRFVARRGAASPVE
jgi:hypothetical protein